MIFHFSIVFAELSMKRLSQHLIISANGLRVLRADIVAGRLKKKVSFRPYGCVVSEGVQRWMIILCSLQRLYGRVWLFFSSTPHLKILSNSPQVKHLLDRWLKFTFFLNFKTQAKTNKIPAKKEGSCALRSINSPLWCEMMKKLPKELRKIKVYQ